MNVTTNTTTTTNNSTTCYYTPIKTNILVLAGSLISFQTFLALGVTDSEKMINDYIFVDTPEILKEFGYCQVHILSDFSFHPNVIEILDILNGGLTYNETNVLRFL